MKNFASIHPVPPASSAHSGAHPHLPIYQKLFDQYRGDILSFTLQPGDRLDSITDIQEKHKVSRETAKKVLDMLSAGGFITQKAGKGSFVNDIGPRKPIWGVVLPFYSLQYEYLLRRIITMAASRDREVRHYCAYNNWNEEIRLAGWMLNEKFEKVLVIPTQHEELTKAFYKRLSTQDGQNIVMIDHAKPSNPFSYSAQNYQTGVELAMKHLLSGQTGRVAYVKNSTWGDRNLVQKLMEQTYVQYLHEHHPDMEPLVLLQGDKLPGRMLKDSGVTGLFCEDDLCAIQCIGNLRDQGLLVPGDFSLVSYGNTDLARYFTPAITAIDPRRKEVADGILKIFDNEGAVTHFMIDPELVVRGT